MCPTRRLPAASRCSAAARPPPSSSGSTACPSSPSGWVIAYTTGMPGPATTGGRGSTRRPVTIRPSTRRADSVSDVAALPVGIIPGVAHEDRHLPGAERILGAQHDRDAEPAETVAGDQAHRERTARQQRLGQRVRREAESLRRFGDALPRLGPELALPVECLGGGADRHAGLRRHVADGHPPHLVLLSAPCGLGIRHRRQHPDAAARAPRRRGTRTRHRGPRTRHRGPRTPHRGPPTPHRGTRTPAPLRVLAAARVTPRMSIN